MTKNTGDEDRRPRESFAPYFDWRHNLFGNNMGAATLQLVAGTAIVSAIFALIWTCFVE